MVTLRLHGSGSLGADGPTGAGGARQVGQFPLHERVAASVRRAIVDGEVGPGDALPTAREVAAAFGVHPNTVLRAYRALRDEGTIELRAGRGAHVRRDLDPASRVVEHVERLARAAAREGLATDQILTLVRASLERLRGDGSTGGRTIDGDRTVPGRSGPARTGRRLSA
jgi:GntR family transcriptional regulator